MPDIVQSAEEGAVNWVYESPALILFIAPRRKGKDLLSHQLGICGFLETRDVVVSTEWSSLDDCDMLKITKKTHIGFSYYINENVHSSFLRMEFSNVLNAEEK